MGHDSSILKVDQVERPEGSDEERSTTISRHRDTNQFTGIRGAKLHYLQSGVKSAADTQGDIHSLQSRTSRVPQGDRNTPR